MDDKKAIVIFCPGSLLKDFHKIQMRLVRELEKKFSGKHVLIVSEVGKLFLYNMLYIIVL